MGEERRINMIFLVVKNEDDSIEVMSPDTYGMDTWGNSSQTSLEQRNDGTWYIHYWSDGGQWLDDIREEDKLNVIFESENTDDIYKFVKEYYPNQLEEIDQQIKEDLETFESLREWLHE